MSMAMGHFAFGVGATTGILMATGLDKKIKNTEPIRVAGGLFAMLPDASKLIPHLKSFHDSWLANFFYFHHLLDTKFDPKDSVWISFLLIVFMLIMLGFYWRKRSRVK